MAVFAVATALNAENVATNTVAASLNHKLAPRDTVSFQIDEDRVDLRQPQIPQQLSVSDAGELEVPYVGAVRVEGKTCREAAVWIGEELEKQYYYHATVRLSLESTVKSMGVCYVSGQVHQSGAIELSGDASLTLSKAVVRAGGFTEFADKRHVRLTRHPAKAGITETWSFDLIRILEEGKAENDPVLCPGDTIFVPSKLLNL